MNNAPEYHVLSNLDNSFTWEEIWNWDVPNKVKMFMWRLAHDRLAVRRNLARRGMQVDTCWPMCCRVDEDYKHLFLKCKGAKENWRILNLEEYRKALLPCCSGKDLIQRIWSFTSQVQTTIILLIWRWWSARNKANVGENTITGPEVCSLMILYVRDFNMLKNKSKK